MRYVPVILTLAAAFALAVGGSTTATAALVPVGGPASTTVPVLAAGTAFASPVLVVPAGTTVQWIGVLFPHTVTTTAGPVESATGAPNDATNSDGDPDTFNRGLPQGSTFSHTFQEPGVYSYYCIVHRQAGMVGEVVVV